MGIGIGGDLIRAVYQSDAEPTAVTVMWTSDAHYFCVNISATGPTVVVNDTGGLRLPANRAGLTRR